MGYQSSGTRVTRKRGRNQTLTNAGFQNKRRRYSTTKLSRNVRPKVGIKNKKYASWTRTIRKRRKRRSDNVQAMDVDYLTVKKGRPEKMDVKHAWKRLHTDEMPVYYRYQGILSYTAARGYYQMDRTVIGTPGQAGASEALPLYLFDLTAVPYNGSTQNSGVGSRLSLVNSSTGFNNVQYYFDQDLNAGTNQNPAGVDVAGSSVTNNNYWTDNVGTNFFGPGRTDQLSYLDIRLVCVAALTYPTEYEISLVQLQDEWLHPHWRSTTNSGQDNIAWNQLRNAFWENEVYKYCTNPIAIVNPKTKKLGQKRVMWQTKFTIQPKSTISTQVEGAHKIVKLFKWMNRLQRYDWTQNGSIQKGAGGALLVGGYLPAGGFPVNDVTANAETVHPKARIYLMVKATSLGASGSIDTPSFDLVIRKKHICSQNTTKA